jgi:hypothetical protein
MNEQTNKKQRSYKNMTTAPTATLSPKTSTETFDIAYGWQKTGTKKDVNGNEVPVREAVMVTPEKAEELEKAGQFEGTVVTVRVDYPANFDAIVDFANKSYTDDDGKPRDVSEVKQEILKLFTNGAKGKVMNRLRAKLTATDKDGNFSLSDSDLTEGVLDMTNEITSGSKRIFLTEEQKTWRSLENLPGTVRENMWKVYLQSLGKTFYIPEE